MIFNSIEFILFFITVFALYWFAFKEKTKLQNWLLLFASYFFYGFANWKILPLLIALTAIFYVLGIAVYNTREEKRNKLYTILGIVIGLGVLLYFKYTNFFISSFKDLFGNFGLQTNWHSLKIIVPVGISFYTFRLLSYIIDIHRSKYAPTHDIVAFASYVSFFPSILSGPIDRPNILLPQLQNKRIFDYNLAVDGMRQILWGLFKKLVIADRLAILVNTVYNNPQNCDGIQLIIAALFFTVQIYCDFSGYSDMAIGVAKMFGIKLNYNFNLPYLSKSVTEFWKRWHISLSTWFMDYLYIPLGGNRVNLARNIFNLFVVFVVSGLWHGANLTFIIWGAIHGLFIVIEKLTIKKEYLKSTDYKLSFFNFLRTIGTFLIVTFAWISFRANTFSDFMYIMKNIFNFNLTHLSVFYKSGASKAFFAMDTLDFILSFILIIFLFIAEFISRKSSVEETVKFLPKKIQWGIYIVFTIIILWFGKFGLSQFIYSQF